MSYFVGGSAVDDGYAEDAGFAINGGKGWSKVVFNNHAIDLHGPVAVAMGSYEFTCATSSDVVKVEYTFGYKRNEDGKARIFLHQWVPLRCEIQRLSGLPSVYRYHVLTLLSMRNVLLPSVCMARSSSVPYSE